MMTDEDYERKRQKKIQEILNLMKLQGGDSSEHSVDSSSRQPSLPRINTGMNSRRSINVSSIKRSENDEKEAALRSELTKLQQRHALLLSNVKAMEVEKESHIQDILLVKTLVMEKDPKQGQLLAEMIGEDLLGSTRPDPKVLAGYQECLKREEECELIQKQTSDLIAKSYTYVVKLKQLVAEHELIREDSPMKQSEIELSVDTKAMGVKLGSKLNPNSIRSGLAQPNVSERKLPIKVMNPLKFDKKPKPSIPSTPVELEKEPEVQEAKLAEKKKKEGGKNRNEYKVFVTPPETRDTEPSKNLLSSVLPSILPESLQSGGKLNSIGSLNLHPSRGTKLRVKIQSDNKIINKMDSHRGEVIHDGSVRDQFFDIRKVPPNFQSLVKGMYSHLESLPAEKRMKTPPHPEVEISQRNLLSPGSSKSSKRKKPKKNDFKKLATTISPIGIVSDTAFMLKQSTFQEDWRSQDKFHKFRQPAMTINDHIIDAMDKVTHVPGGIHISGDSEEDAVDIELQKRNSRNRTSLDLPVKTPSPPKEGRGVQLEFDENMLLFRPTNIQKETEPSNQSKPEEVTVTRKQTKKKTEKKEEPKFSIMDEYLKLQQEELEKRKEKAQKQRLQEEMKPVEQDDFKWLGYGDEDISVEKNEKPFQTQSKDFSKELTILQKGFKIFNQTTENKEVEGRRTKSAGHIRSYKANQKPQTLKKSRKSLPLTFQKHNITRVFTESKASSTNMMMRFLPNKQSVQIFEKHYKTVDSAKAQAKVGHLKDDYVIFPKASQKKGGLKPWVVNGAEEEKLSVAFDSPKEESPDKYQSAIKLKGILSSKVTFRNPMIEEQIPQLPHLPPNNPLAKYGSPKVAILKHRANMPRLEVSDSSIVSEHNLQSPGRKSSIEGTPLVEYIVSIEREGRVMPLHVRKIRYTETAFCVTGIEWEVSAVGETKTQKFKFGTWGNDSVIDVNLFGDDRIENVYRGVRGYSWELEMTGGRVEHVGTRADAGFQKVSSIAPNAKLFAIRCLFKRHQSFNRLLHMEFNCIKN